MFVRECKSNGKHPPTLNGGYIESIFENLHAYQFKNFSIST